MHTLLLIFVFYSVMLLCLGRTVLWYCTGSGIFCMTSSRNIQCNGAASTLVFC